MILNVGSTVKIKPEIFGTSPEETGLYGSLGYVGLFRHLTFRIESLVEDPNRGKGAMVSIVDPNVLIGIAGIKSAKYNEGKIFMVLDDLVESNLKITLDYEIKVRTVDNNELVKSLFDERSKLKQLGRKMSDPLLRDNWRKIQAARRDIESGKIRYQDENATVIVQGGRYKFNVPTSVLPKDDEESLKKFQSLIISMIRTQRQTYQRLVYRTKDFMGEPVKLLGGVYTEGGQPMKAYEKSLIKTLRSDKVPRNTSANYVGVEIEFVYNGRMDKLENLFIKHRLHKNVQMTTDGSVHACHNAPRGYAGGELRILGTENTIEEVLRKTCSVITCGAIDGYVNRSCGLHVHLDMRKRDAKMVYTNLVRVMNLLTRSQPAGRTLSHFCVPNKHDEMNATQEGLTNRKYLVVNPMPYLNDRNTIEVRVHEGSVDADAINNWVQFLNAIANHGEVIPKKNYESAKQLAKIVNIPTASVNYIDSRIERYYTDAV